MAPMEMAHSPNPEYSDKLRNQHRLLLMFALIPLLLIVLHGINSHVSRNRELSNGAERIQGFAHMYAEEVSRALASIDVLIDEISKQLGETRDWNNWGESHGHEILRSRKSGSIPQLRDTAVFDTTGRQRFHSSLYPAPIINITDRPYFQALRDGARRVLYGPYKGRNTGVMTFAMTRRLNDGNGNFSGVAFAAIEPAHFQSVCWHGKFEKAMRAFLVNSAGVIVAECRPPDEITAGKSAIGHPIQEKFAKLPAEMHWSVEQSLQAGSDVLVVHPVDFYPELTIVAALAEDDILEDWHHDFRIASTILVICLLLIIGGLSYAWRQMSHQSRIEQELRRANEELENHHLGLEQVVKERTKELSEARDAAVQASRSKDSFLANMSHEIRTPMNGVIGMVDVLMQTELHPAQQKMVRTIQNSSLYLLTILNDILDYSKIEAGKLSLEVIPTYLREIIEGVALLQFPAASAKNVELSVFVSPLLPPWILSDPTRLRQILLNLLGNAMKFTHSGTDRQGRVTVCAEPCCLPDGRAGLQLRVSDNGIGMSQESVTSLFQPFTQADQSTARKFGGTGLGLSISHRLAEMMNGRISVRSAMGKGSEFSVELPLLESAAARVIEAEPRLDSVRVLAVTRDSFASTILPAYCGAVGAELHLLPDLEAARHALKQPMPPATTVVLLGLAVNTPTPELHLPESASVVRLVERNKSSPFSEVCIAARPLLYHDLIHGLALASRKLTVSASVEHRERRSDARQPAPGLEEAVASGRLILLAEDNETNREVMREQLRLLGYACEMAEDGQVALDMWRTRRYALLLTDCHMPNMDGFELTATIRHAERDQGRRAPIIAVTANAMQGEAERCIERGMDDYLSKPLRLNELGPMLAKWLPLPESAPELAPVPATAAVPPAPTFQDTIWDASVLTKMVGDNPAMHRRLLERFIPSAREQVGRICAAAANDDTATVGSTAHALKSSARTIGALQLGDLCEQLEYAGHAGDTSRYRSLSKELPNIFASVMEQINAALARR